MRVLYFLLVTSNWKDPLATVQQNKQLTAGIIIKRGGQANPICPLCHTTPETAIHLMLNCFCARSVWVDMKRLFHRPNISHQLTQLLQHNGAISVKHWWSSMLENLKDKQQQKEFKLLHILPGIYGKKHVAESSITGCLIQISSH